MGAICISFEVGGKAPSGFHLRKDSWASPSQNEGLSSMKAKLSLLFPNDKKRMQF